MRLEKMDQFFEARLDGYEEHMLRNIAGADEFYPFTAGQLPEAPGAAVLDLGCGTGLELRWYFARNPDACMTGIDLSAGMLAELRKHYPERKLNLICGSYFDVPLGTDAFDAAVSVESLHHFTKEEKTALYAKVRQALKPKGFLILTDYFAMSDEEERQLRQNLTVLREAQGAAAGEIYHYDTPLTVDHEIEALQEAGFTCVEILGTWGPTYCLKAKKES